MFLWTALYLCHFVAITLQQPGNSPSPLSFPIRNVTLQSNVIKRGFPLSIGTPPQQMSLAIHADRDNMMVHTGNRVTGAVGEREGCGLLCIRDSGGLFQPDVSTSMKLSANQGNETNISGEQLEEHSNFVEVSLGNDTLNFNSTFALPDFELKAAGVGKRPEQSLLGLGRNSHLLERLYADKKILSRSWSLFWGLEGGDEIDQMDGSLVLGGYDKAKIGGNNFTGDLALDDGCSSSMLVFLDDIRVDFPGGIQVSLFASQGERSSKRSCIKPEVELITLPTNLRQRFMSIIGGTYVGPSSSLKDLGMVVSADNAFKGNLTFVLASGLALTIPNHLLLVPEIHANTTGPDQFEFLPYDPSVREILISSQDTGNESDITLGQLFLTSVYLHVNNDESKFTLWQANPTKHEHLVTVGKTTNWTFTASQKTPITYSKHKSAVKLLAAAAVGKVVGASIGISALILLVVFWKRKRQSDPQPQGAKSRMYGTFMEILHESPKAFPRGTSIARELVWRPIHETPVPGPRTLRRVELATVAEDTPLLLPPRDQRWYSGRKGGRGDAGFEKARIMV